MKGGVEERQRKIPARWMGFHLESSREEVGAKWRRVDAVDGRFSPLSSCVSGVQSKCSFDSVKSSPRLSFPTLPLLLLGGILPPFFSLVFSPPTGMLEGCHYEELRECDRLVLVVVCVLCGR